MPCRLLLESQKKYGSLTLCLSSHDSAIGSNSSMCCQNGASIGSTVLIHVLWKNRCLAKTPFSRRKIVSGWFFFQIQLTLALFHNYIVGTLSSKLKLICSLWFYKTKIAIIREILEKYDKEMWKELEMRWPKSEIQCNVDSLTMSGEPICTHKFQFENYSTFCLL